MVNDPSLRITKTDIGAMTSAFPAAYGAYMYVNCCHIRNVSIIHIQMLIFELQLSLCSTRLSCIGIRYHTVRLLLCIPSQAELVLVALYQAVHELHATLF